MYREGVESDRRDRPAGWDRLELAVRRLLDDYDDQVRSRAAAEVRVRELESTIEEISKGELDPIVLRERVDELEAENRELRERLEKARAKIERIMARLDFLEDRDG